MANKTPGTDRDLLVKKAYATDELLLIRQRTHDLYSYPKIDYPQWVLDRVLWAGTESVLDLGAGAGTYFSQLRQRIPRGVLIAGDLSMGMLHKAQKHPDKGDLINLDAEHLPFPNQTFDYVLANHMLYHVPDIDRALREIRRVLKTDGSLLAATNSQFNLPEIEQLIRRTYSLLGAVGLDIEPMQPIPHRFYLEDGAVKLARHFYAVARFDLPGKFVFTSVKPAIEYINSTRALREPQLPRRIKWEDFIGVMADQIQRLINHFGELEMNKLSGVLIGTQRGGFAEDYVNRLNHR